MKAQTMILLAGLLALPACGTEGLKEAQAQAADEPDEPQPIPDRDDADLASDSVPTPIPALKEPARATAPAPTAVRLTVPAATQIEVEFTTQVSSETSHPGDSFSARLTKDVMIENRVAVPAGAELTGTVTEAVATKKIGGQARLALAFETLSLASGQSTALAATLITEGKKQTTKDAATIGGSTAGGALLGRVLAGDKQKGTAIGAVVGAAAGTTIAATNKADPVTFAEGTIVPVTLQQPIVVVLEGRNRRFQR
jgi:hypothetical protein